MHDAHALGGKTQLARSDRRDVAVHALSHFGAAVIDLRSTVLKKQEERAGLIEMRGRKRNSELHRRDRDPALAMSMLLVPAGDLLSARREIARRHQFVPDPLDP